MKDILEEILRNYKFESRNKFANNRLANYIRNDIPRKIFLELQLNSNQFKVTASPGQGNWAAVPWIGIFDKILLIRLQRGMMLFTFSKPI